MQRLSSRSAADARHQQSSRRADAEWAAASETAPSDPRAPSCAPMQPNRPAGEEGIGRHENGGWSVRERRIDLMAAAGFEDSDR